MAIEQAARAGHCAEQQLVIETRALSKHFGGLYAVKNVSIAVKHGETIGLIGPNGAGKTSLMNLISGVLPVEEGDVCVSGERITGFDAIQSARAGVSRTFQNIRIFDHLTVEQNVAVALTTARRHRSHRFSGRSAIDFLKLMGIEENAETRADALPYGTKRRLEIARALALHPEILLLDEPAAGMNESESSALMQDIRELHQHFSFGILVIDHDLHFIMSLCERLYVMDMGEIISHGTPAELRNDPRVQEVYLGTHQE